MQFNQFFNYYIHNKKFWSPELKVKVKGTRYGTEI